MTGKSDLRLRAEQSECPHCMAGPGGPCWSLVDNAAMPEAFHKARYEAAKYATPAERLKAAARRAHEALAPLVGEIENDFEQALRAKRPPEPAAQDVLDWLFEMADYADDELLTEEIE